MKKLIIIIPLLIFSLRSFSQQNNANSEDYAIVQVLMPLSVLGNFEIRILYGNDKIDNFRNIKYNKENREKVSNHIVDVMNLMKSKGYKFKHGFTITHTMIESQYIFEKE